MKYVADYDSLAIFIYICFSEDSGAACGGRWDRQQTITDQKNATRRTGISRSQRIQTAVAQELGHDILEELTNYIFSL
jgi:hypothetical protein